MRRASLGVIGVALACSGSGAKQTGGAGGASATAGNGSKAASSSVQQASSQAAVSTAASTTDASASSSSGGPTKCNPPPDPGTLFALNDTTATLDAQKMCDYQGDVLLIVNLAEL